MEMRYLGRTGLRVSEICLGVMNFGGHPEWTHIGALNQTEADEFVSRALAAGVNFFDTADIYNFGESEEMLGKSLGGRRQHVVITTKVGFDMKQGPNSNGASRRHILESCEQSLQRLGTDYIDIYLIHCFDPGTPQEETLAALDDLVRQGKVRYIGCSNYTGWHLMQALALSEKMGLARFTALQALYNLVQRDVEYELGPLCQEQEVGIMTWSPLAGGFLSGKYRRDQPRPKGVRLEKRENQNPFDEERGYEIIAALEKVAREHQVTIPQVALRYLIQKPAVTSVVIGARNLDQLQDNLHAATWKLSEDEMQTLDQISNPRPVYPYWFIESARGDRLRER